MVNYFNALWRIILFLILVSLAIILSGIILFKQINSVIAEEYMPTDFLVDEDKFELIIGVDGNGERTITYSYECSN